MGCPEQQDIHGPYLIDELMDELVLELDGFEIRKPYRRCADVLPNSRNRSTRLAGGLPAMSAELIAPIEIPATQSG